MGVHVQLVALHRDHVIVVLEHEQLGALRFVVALRRLELVVEALRLLLGPGAARRHFTRWQRGTAGAEAVAGGSGRPRRC